MRGRAWEEIASTMDSPPVWEMRWALPWQICWRGNKQILALTPFTIWLRNSKHDIIHTMWLKGDLWLMILIRVTRSIPLQWMHGYCRTRLASTRSWLSRKCPTQTGPHRGIVLWMIQAMNHYQRQERRCSCVGILDTSSGSARIVKLSMLGARTI